MALTLPEEDHHIDIDATEARQGRRGLHALTILAVSTVLTILVFLIAYGVNHRNLQSVNGAPVASPSEVQKTNSPVTPGP